MTAKTVLTTICDRCDKEHQVDTVGSLTSLPRDWSELHIKEQKNYSAGPFTMHLCPDCNKKLWDEFLTNKKAAQAGGTVVTGSGEDSGA